MNMMKKLVLISWLVFSMLPPTQAQATTSNGTKSKPVSPDPGKAAPALKKAPEPTEPRSVQVPNKMPAVKK